MARLNIEMSDGQVRRFLDLYNNIPYPEHMTFDEPDWSQDVADRFKLPQGPKEARTLTRREMSRLQQTLVRKRSSEISKRRSSEEQRPPSIFERLEVPSMKDVEERLKGVELPSLKDVEERLKGTLNDAFSPLVATTSAAFRDLDGNPIIKTKAEIERQITYWQMTFCMNEITIKFQEEKSDGEVQDTFLFRLGSSTIEMLTRMWETRTNAVVSSLTVTALQYDDINGVPLRIIYSGAGTDGNLLCLSYLAVLRQCPEFQSVYNSTEQLLDIKMTALKVKMQPRALLKFNELLGTFGGAGELQAAAVASSNVLATPATPSRRESGTDQKFGAQSAGELLKPLLARLSVVAVGETATGGASQSLPAVLRKTKALAPVIVSLHVELHLGSFDVFFIDNNNRYIGDLQTEGFNAGSVTTDSSTKVHVRLRNLLLMDASPYATHKHIVSVFGNDVFQLQYATYNLQHQQLEKDQDIEVVDSSVVLKVERTKVVVLNKFVQAMLAYLQQFSETDVAVIAKNASNRAQKKAAEKAAQLAETNPRVRMDIRMAAPTVVVPVDSKSLQVVVANLGTLTLSNSLRWASQAPGAIIDDVQVTLDEVEVSSGQLTFSDDLLFTDTPGKLLEKVTVSIEVRRNMSTPSPLIPDVHVHARIPTIKLRIGTADTRLLMAIARQNFTEAEPSVVAASQQQQKPRGRHSRTNTGEKLPAPADAKSRKLLQEKASIFTVRSSQTSARPTADEPVRDTLEAKFELEGVELELFNDEQQRESLARIRVSALRTSTTLRSDDTLVTSVTVDEVILDDVREKAHPALPGITRLVQNQFDLKDFFVVKMTRDADGDVYVTATVTSVLVIINAEYHARFLAFLYEAMKQPIPVAPEAVHRTAKTASQKTSMLGMERFVATNPSHLSKARKGYVDPKASKLSAAATVVAAVEKRSKTTVSFVLHEPQMVLVTDVRSLNAEALVVGFGMKLSMEFSGADDTQLMGCTLDNLNVLACSFKHVLYKDPVRALTHKRILDPCSIQLKGHSDPTSERYEVTMSDLRLKASPLIINMMSEVYTHLREPFVSTSTETHPQSLAPKSPWVAQKICDLDRWYLTDADQLADEEWEEVSADPSVEETDSACSKSQRADFDCSRITIQLEAGGGRHTVPMFIMECTLKGDVEGWGGGKMRASGKLTLGMAYFNDTRSVWEPLIEPVEVDPAALEPVFEPWFMTAELQQNEPVKDDAPTSDGISALISISIQSKQVLNMTISNAAVEVIRLLAAGFRDATLSGEAYESKREMRMKEGGRLAAVFSEVLQSGAEVVVRNSLGFPVHVRHDDKLTLVDNSGRRKAESYELRTGDHLLLDYHDDSDPDLWTVLANQEVVLTDGARIFVSRRVDGDEACVDVTRTGLFLNLIEDESRGAPSVHFVAMIESTSGIKTVTLRSHVMLHNHLHYEVAVQQTNAHGALQPVGVVAANRRLSMPIWVVREKRWVQIRPMTDDDDVGTCDISWAAAMDRPDWKSVLVRRCMPLTPGTQPVCINVEFDEDELVNSQGLEFLERGLTVHLYPCVVLHNLLPFTISFRVTAAVDEDCPVWKELEAGNTAQLSNVEVGSGICEVMLPSYMERTWTSNIELVSNVPELSLWTFYDAQHHTKQLILAKQITYEDGIMKVTVYAPYWMVNKTGMTLEYKASDEPETKALQHGVGTDILLFAFTRHSFMSKNKLQLRVANCQFSDGFTIDAIGNEGTITCKRRKFSYTIGTKIELTSFSLTKTVTFTPYYYLVNQSEFDLEFCEADDPLQQWQHVASHAQLAFWPEHKGDCLVVRLQGIDISKSVKFRYTKLESGVLLRVGAQALFAEVSITDASLSVSICDYFEGSSAVLLINHTNSTLLDIWQNGTDKMVAVNPGDATHFLWTNPNVTRQLTWSTPGGEKTSVDICQDQAGSFDTNKAHYVVFMDGLQRVLLFSDVKRQLKLAHKAMFIDQACLQVETALRGVSWSFTDTNFNREVAFVAVDSSGIVWEVKQRRKWRPLAVKYSNGLESHYQSNLISKNVTVDDMTFDMVASRVRKPFDCPLQRSYSPGFWLRYIISEQHLTLHAKINRAQIDNQLRGAIFPVVLSPTPLPRSIAINSTPKPLFEASIMQHVNDNLAFTHIKYFKMLVQEINIKLDVGLLNALSTVLGVTDEVLTEAKEKKYFQQDLDRTLDVAPEVFTSKHSFFDLVHLSPIKLHLSFSMEDNVRKNERRANVVEKRRSRKNPLLPVVVLLKSLGVTLSDVNDVVFKLSYFERTYQFFGGNDFKDAIQRHYVGQAIKQAYVLLFGLEILGNPFGLVRGIGEGVKSLFYEPYQGIIQGPEEFFDGLRIGALSLLGHTFGGAAGMVSKMTGALGKGLATISCDDEFQRERMRAKNQQPHDVKERFARGGKSLVMGVFSGVTGIVTQPVQGARKDGASGFFKGMGKGLIGVVARPIGGFVDMTSHTFGGISHVAGIGEEVQRMRPARWINMENGIIQPYSWRSAHGALVLMEVDKGAFAHLSYVQHVFLREDKKTVFFVTDSHVLTARTSDVLSVWKLDWKSALCDIAEIAFMPPRELQFFLKQMQPQSRSIFGPNTPTPVKHVVEFMNGEQAQILRKEIIRRKTIQERS